MLSPASQRRVAKVCLSEWQLKCGSNSGNSLPSAFIQYFIITISGNAADGLIQRSLVLRFPVTVDKDKIRVPINRDRAADPESS